MKSTKDKASVYARSGVDIDAADAAKDSIKKLAHSTFRSEVLTDIGLFGSMFQIKGHKNTVLVSSADGVGTKLKIASLMGKHDTVGKDLVNHCVNDILCCGAEPLFFLDYIAMGKLIPHKVQQIVSGLASACKESNCALVGGETAEMPGMYHGDDYDLVGFIVGEVDRRYIISGGKISAGDIVLGLPSSGLHTNGYSLVRSIFNVEKQPSVLKQRFPGLQRNLGQALLEPHRCYYTLLKPFLRRVKGLAHITGGGFVGNIPRILPAGMAVRIDKKSWKVPAIFSLIQQKGSVSEEEMYRVFNMGIGMVVICAPRSEIINKLAGKSGAAVIIGEVVKDRKSGIIFI